MLIITLILKLTSVISGNFFLSALFLLIFIWGYFISNKNLLDLFEFSMKLLTGPGTKRCVSSTSIISVLFITVLVFKILNQNLFLMQTNGH